MGKMIAVDVVRGKEGLMEEGVRGSEGGEV